MMRKLIKIGEEYAIEIDPTILKTLKIDDNTILEIKIEKTACNYSY